MPARQDAIDLQRRTAMPTTDAIGEQVIEAVIAGPEGANRLFTISGAANVCIEATRQQRTTETCVFGTAAGFGTGIAGAGSGLAGTPPGDACDSSA